jgi:hypothetical protein
MIAWVALKMFLEQVGPHTGNERNILAGCRQDRYTVGLSITVLTLCHFLFGILNIICLSVMGYYKTSRRCMLCSSCFHIMIRLLSGYTVRK